MSSCTSNEWTVTFHGGYWGQDGAPGKEIPIGKAFRWGERVWHIPAGYACPEGIILDLCVEVEPEKVKAFFDKWYPILREDPHPPKAVRRQVEAEHPLRLPHFHARLTVNGTPLEQESGCGMSWIPESCLPEDMEDRAEAKALIEHYGLDDSRGWSFQRARFPWDESMDVTALELTLEQLPQTIYGPSFPTPAAGEEIHFTHPITGTRHTLTVLDIQNAQFDKDIPGEGIEEWPRHYIFLEYTLSPDLTSHQFALRDTVESDAPRLKSAPEHPSGAARIGIIGSADGPTAMLFSHDPDPKPHGARSALHFAPVEAVTWQAEFREKLLEDISVKLS